MNPAYVIWAFVATIGATGWHLYPNENRVFYSREVCEARAKVLQPSSPDKLSCISTTEHPPEYIKTDAGYIINLAWVCGRLERARDDADVLKMTASPLPPQCILLKYNLEHDFSNILEMSK